MSYDNGKALPFELTLAAATELGLSIPVATLSKQDYIRALNDALRLHGIGGRVTFTRSIADLDDTVRRRIIQAVRAFDAFDSSNDPHNEHDCANLDVDGITVMFKIDYYDLDLQFLSPDPADPEVTCRVLTIMLADDY